MAMPLFYGMVEVSKLFRNPILWISVIVILFLLLISPEEKAPSLKLSTEPVDIKNALETWSLNLPTEYLVSDVGNYCNKEQITGCQHPKLIRWADIEEGYTVKIGSNSFDSGRGSVYLFDSEKSAKDNFSVVINDIKGERGYTELSVPNNCFGWAKSMTIVTHLHVVCHRSKLIYSVGFTDDENVVKYSKQLGDILIG